MASFISTLSLFLLVLASGYYAVPVTYETTSLSTELGHETTEVPKHMPRFSHDTMDPEPTSLSTELGHETTEVPKHVPRFSHDTMDSETTSPGDTSEEHMSHGLRFVPIDDKDEPSTSETITHEPREISELSNTFKITTEKPIIKETTPSQHGAESESAEDTGMVKPKSEKTYQRRGMSDESTIPSTTTLIMPSHSTSSSTVIPEIHSGSSTSTRKYTGLLKDEESQPTEGEHSGKPNKTKPKPEDPTVTLGSKIVDLNSVPEIGNVNEETMHVVTGTNSPVTDPSTTTMEGKPKPAKKPLNEGQKSSQSEEEKSD